VEHEDPVDLTVTLPPGSPLDGPALRGHLEDELRTRAEVVSAEGDSVTVRAYRREEVEAVADELIAKLSKIARVKDGTIVRWLDDSGAESVRPV
jgi:hypothetical protein